MFVSLALNAVRPGTFSGTVQEHAEDAAGKGTTRLLAWDGTRVALTANLPQLTTPASILVSVN